VDSAVAAVIADAEVAMDDCPNPEAHPSMLDFYGECTWCGATDLPKPTDGKA